MTTRLTVTLLFALALTAAGADPAFRDRTADLCPGLANGQACWVDLDNDGWSDLVAGGVVWHNDAGKGFSKLAEGVGAVVAADYDNDGYTDLFSWSALKLYHNDAGRTFSNAPLPELPPCVSRGACWADLNGDGVVDLFVGGYEDWNKNITYPSLILMNEGGRSFRLAGTDDVYRARGVTACDFDEDGDLDVYVSDYRLQPNRLWLNDGRGRLTDRAADYNVIATSPGFDGGHSIGAAWGDFDNDGDFDLFAGNFAHVDSRGDQPKSRFLRSRGPAGKYVFDDLGTCGVYYQESYASPAAGDYDNDGDLDLLFTTVYGTASFGRKNYPVLYRNDGRYRFADATAAAGVTELAPTYQAAWGDYDNDGDLDLVSAGRLFENQGTGYHWLAVRLQGDGKAVNRSAIGAQVRVELRNQTLTRQVEAGTGEGNQNDLTLHFGVNNLTGPFTVEITWPGGRRQALTGVPADRVLTVQYQQEG
jgi:hypothetical protein